MRRHDVVVRARWLACAVFALAWLAYGTALAGDYVFDDIHSVSANPALRDLGRLPTYWVDPAAFSPGRGVMYRPALLTSFALNLWLSPAAWSLKAGNVLLHALAAVLLFAWAFRLSRALRASAVAAALFAVHPLASEAINMVSARSELLVLVGLFVVLHTHLSWSRRQGVWLPCAGLVVGTVLACGSKETGVVAPVLCAVQAFVLRHGGLGRAAWGRQLAGLAPVVTTVLLYLVARKLLLGEATVQLLHRTGDDPLSGHGRSLAVQLATMGTLLPQAVLQVLVPWRLSLDPVVHYRDSFLALPVLAGWGAVAVLVVWCVAPGPGARLRRLGGAVAGAVALPWIVVPLNMPYAEHRMYGPLAGAALVLVALAPRLRRGLARAQLPMRHLAAAALGCAVVAGAVHSAGRSWLYRDERALWRAELAQHPTSFRSWWGLGACEFRLGEVAAAIEPLARAHELNPRHFDTLRNYAEALASLPDQDAVPARTLAAARRLTGMAPRDPWARTLEVQALLQQGRVHGDRDAFAQAETLALSCLQIAPPKGYVYRLAAMARRGLGDLPGALAHLDTSLAAGLKATEVRLDRAAVLRDLGRHREAQRELLVAQREAPGDAMVMSALAQFATPGR